MNALEVIREVEARGGKLVLDGDQLKLKAPQPLPDEIMAAVSEQKATIMTTLGAPLDAVVAGILEELRPNLPASLRKLPDDRLLALVNWSIIAAWEKTIQKLRIDQRKR